MATAEEAATWQQIQELHMYFHLYPCHLVSSDCTNRGYVHHNATTITRGPEALFCQREYHGRLALRTVINIYLVSASFSTSQLL